MEVRKSIVVLTRPMQRIRTKPDHSLRLVVPGCTSVIVPITKPVDSHVACGWTDCSCSDWIGRTLAFECVDDRVRTCMYECCARFESKIRDQAPLCDPEVVSVTDARATMPSKSRGVHNDVAVRLC